VTEAAVDGGVGVGVGVVLPARLETRFVQGDGGMVLQLAVLPAEPWIDRHDRRVGADELDLLRDALDATDGRPFVRTTEARAAFERLAGQVGAGRAAWLLRDVAVQSVDGRLAIPDGAELGPSVSGGALPRAPGSDSAPAVIRGLPAELQVWAELDDDPSRPVLLGTLHPVPELPVEPRDPRSSDERLPRFWADAATLRHAGLLADLPLAGRGDDGDDIDPQSISCLFVVGAGDAEPGPLLSAHAHADQLALLPAGTPTNVTPEAAHPAPHPLHWHASVTRQVTADPALSDAAGPAVAAALTGAADGLPAAPGWLADHTEVQQDLVTALWPVLWGHSLHTLWGDPAHLGEGAGAFGWWQRWLRPDGPYPSLLVGDQPYGLLPATPLTSLGPYAGRLNVSDGVGPRLARALDHLLLDTARRAERAVGTVVDGDARQVERVLRQTPTSDGYAYRWTVPSADLEDVVRERHRRVAATVVEPLEGDPWAAEHVQLAVGPARPVTLPFVHPAPPPEHVLEFLEEVLEQMRGEGVAGTDGLEAHLPTDTWRIVVRWLSWRMERDLPDGGYSGSALYEVVSELIERYDGRHPDSLLLRLIVASLSLAWRTGGWLASGLPAQGTLPAWQDLSEQLDAWPAGGEQWVEPVLRWWHAAIEALDRLATRDPAAEGVLERTLSAVVDAAVHRVDPFVTAVASARLDALDGAPRRLGLYGWVDRPARGEPGFTDRGAVLAPSPDQATTAALLRDRAVAARTSDEGPADAWDLSLDSRAVRTALGVLDDVRGGVHPAEAVGRLVEQVLPRDADVRRVREQYPQDRAAPGRHTCDGLRAGEDLAGDGSAFSLATGLNPTTLGDEVWRALQDVGRVVGTAADLLLAESVHAAVQGSTPQLRATLDAAPGLAVPPSLRAQTTPTQGTTVATRVLLGLPMVEDASPAELLHDGPASADPAVAALLDGIGDATDASLFGVRLGEVSTTLGALGLRVADLIVVDQATLARLLRPEAPPEADPAEHPEGGLAAPVQSVEPELQLGPGFGTAYQTVALLRRTRPVATGWAGDVVDPTFTEALKARLVRLRAAAARLCDDVAAATDGGFSPDAALRVRLARWGAVDEPAATVGRLRALLDKPHPEGLADVVAAIQELAAGGRAPTGGAADRTVPLLLPAAIAGTQPLGDPSWLPLVRRVRPAIDGCASTMDALAHAVGAPPAEWTADPAADPWRGRPVDDAGARATTVVVRPSGTQAGALLAVAEIDAWSELVPGVVDQDDRWHGAEVPVTLAVGFKAPAARAPQAIILAIPPADDVALDVDLVRVCVTEARLLARVRTLPRRSLGPLGAVLPSALLPAADRWASVVLDEGATVPTADELTRAHVRLEQAAPEGELARGLRAETADPLWLLARQWQVGEHQGENVASPVLIELSVRDTPLRPPSDRPFADPTRWPGEAILEAATEDVVGGAPGTGSDPYNTSTTRHAVRLPVGDGWLVAAAHDGGAADWWSLDAEGRDLDGAMRKLVRVPGQLRYPGAPNPGWFTLERPDETVTAHVPDAAHVPTLFLLDLLAGHSPDWYLVEAPTAPGHVVTVESMTVIDTFGHRHAFPEASWKGGTDRWAVYRTTGLEDRDLLVWGTTPAPLEGPVLEQVLLGVDEDANVLWIVEQVDGGDVTAPYAFVPSDPLQTPTVTFRTVGPTPRGWHPYPKAGRNPDGGALAAAAARRLFRQGRLVSLESEGIRLTDPPSDEARLLRPYHEPPHLVEPTAVPASGLTLERRWVLARSADGSPVLWQQRRRRPTIAPPAHDTAFDRSSPS
jgi:hypothetical protein